MERTTLWSRVGDWIKHPRRSLGGDATEIDGAQIGQEPSYLSAHGNHDSESGNGHKRHWLAFRGNRRLLEDQTRQVSELVQSLQGHFVRQTQAAESANANLERLISSLSTLPEVVQAQQKALSAIQGQLDAQSAGQKHVQEVLTQLGGIREAVKESSSAFARYSEVAQKTSDVVASEMQKQGQAVAQLAQSADPMMRAISAVRADVGSRGEELVQCVTAMNTRLFQFAVAALILALIATIIVIAAYFR